MSEEKKPYFMTNPDWYWIDEDWEIHIKKDAPEEAKKSFKEWKKDED